MGDGCKFFSFGDGRDGEQVSAAYVVLVLAPDRLDEEGLAACRRLRAERRGTRLHILVLADREQDGEAWSAVPEAGVDDLLYRPFADAELRSRLAMAERLLMVQANLRHKTRECELLGASRGSDETTDLVMDLPGHQHYSDAIVRMHSEALRYGVRYGLMLLGADRFAAYNRRYGESAGDRTLGMVVSLTLSARYRGRI